MSEDACGQARGVTFATTGSGLTKVATAGGALGTLGVCTEKIVAVRARMSTRMRGEAFCME